MFIAARAPTAFGVSHHRKHALAVRMGCPPIGRGVRHGGESRELAARLAADHGQRCRWRIRRGNKPGCTHPHTRTHTRTRCAHSRTLVHTHVRTPTRALAIEDARAGARARTATMRQVKVSGMSSTRMMPPPHLQAVERWIAESLPRVYAVPSTIPHTQPPLAASLRGVACDWVATLCFVALSGRAAHVVADPCTLACACACAYVCVPTCCMAHGAATRWSSASGSCC